MLVKELRAALKDLDDNAKVVVRAIGYGWECYEEVDTAEEKTLYQNGGTMDEETYEGEPKFPVEVVVIK